MRKQYRTVFRYEFGPRKRQSLQKQGWDIIKTTRYYAEVDRINCLAETGFISRFYIGDVEVSFQDVTSVLVVEPLIYCEKCRDKIKIIAYALTTSTSQIFLSHNYIEKFEPLPAMPRCFYITQVDMGAKANEKILHKFLKLKVDDFAIGLEKTAVMKKFGLLSNSSSIPKFFIR